MMKEEKLKAKICDCINGECTTPPENRLFHAGNKCYHVDGTSHEIIKKN